VIDGFVDERDGIVRLLVLSPADVADECGVVKNDPLAVDAGESFKSLVLKVALIEFIRLGVRNERIRRIKRIGTGSAAVEVIDRRLRELPFDQRAKAISCCRLQSETLAKSECMGRIRAIHIAEFVTSPDVEGWGEPLRCSGCWGWHLGSGNSCVQQRGGEKET
jgi:hypothetical protein